ncbi:MAG: hypothetical protein GOP50_08700 [Candidatus Heimdallarchaeota archaeon]|nr:hypothetical protein [Candidatus Heimdallarchaeota archaeon]
MNPSKKLRKLVAEGYQLTPEAFSYLNSLEDVDSVIDEILSSGTAQLILSIDDINEIINQEIEEVKSVDQPADEPVDAKEEQIMVEDKTEDSKSLDSKVSSVEIKKDDLVKEKQLLPKEKKIRTEVRKEAISTDLEVLYSPKVTKTPASAASFRQYFKNRFEVISSYFSKRRDIANRVTTSDLEPNKDRDMVALIALVTKIKRIAQKIVIIEMEDLSGDATGFIYASNPDLIQSSQFILEDSVLCFVGNWRNKRFNIKDVLWPDIPYTHKSNYSYESVLSLHISDIHVGSKNFAGKLFHRVINMINGDLEDAKYNKIGEKIKYLFVAGDIVDGVGVYPGQKDDLVIDSIQLQYHLATEYFDQIRKDVEIIIIPGNHDGARSAEPQTPIQKEFAQDLVSLDNVHLLGSPCYLKAHNVEIMLNHGNSILDINAAIPAIPHETSIPAMREMLKNRHLVPIYGRRTPIAPTPTDELIISRIPDIFHTGHTHIAGDDRYKGVLLLNSGTFQYQTSYQKSMNINPTTGLTYIVNLKNLERSEINFKEIH